MSEYENGEYGWPQPRTSGALLVPPHPPMAPPGAPGLPEPQPSGVKGCLQAVWRWVVQVFRFRPRHDLPRPPEWLTGTSVNSTRR
jgi:hypothetical protein